MADIDAVPKRSITPWVWLVLVLVLVAILLMMLFAGRADASVMLRASDGSVLSVWKQAASTTLMA